MEINLGPVAFRFYGGDNWSFAEVAFITGRNGGLARRETSIHGAFRSEHLIDVLGKDNPHDTYICPEGKTFYGKVTTTPGGGVNVLSAQQVYALQLRNKAIEAANTVNVDANGTPQAA